MRKIFFLISAVVTATVSGSWFVVSAQTWIMSPSPAPDNTTLQTPSAVTGDQMGRIDPHQALMSLSLSDNDNPKYRLYNIRATSEAGVYYPALIINGQDKVGLSLAADQSYGLRAATYADTDGSKNGFKAVNNGGGPALLATTTVAHGLGAKFFGTTVAEGGY